MKIKSRTLKIPILTLSLALMILQGCGIMDSLLSEDENDYKTANITINETIQEGETPVIVVKPADDASSEGMDADAALSVEPQDGQESQDGQELQNNQDNADDQEVQDTLQTPQALTNGQAVGLNPEWQYASFSKINSGTATFYAATENRKGLTVGVNAGHGTNGGGSVKTYCHPDMTPKVTGGTTSAGSIEAVAVSGGMSFDNGEKEADVNLKLARFLRDELLRRGYDVLMIRDGDDVQLDNVARTVICNNCADCHIAIHFDGDSTSSDKGCFFISIPDGIKGMEPVDRTWQMSEELGSQIVAALSNHGHKLHNGGSMDIDLTQTSYSSVPSVDVEYGNQCTDTSDANLSDLASATADGVEGFFQVSN